MRAGRVPGGRRFFFFSFVSPPGSRGGGEVQAARADLPTPCTGALTGQDSIARAARQEASLPARAPPAQAGVRACARANDVPLPLSSLLSLSLCSPRAISGWPWTVRPREGPAWNPWVWGGVGACVGGSRVGRASEAAGLGARERERRGRGEGQCALGVPGGGRTTHISPASEPSSNPAFMRAAWEGRGGQSGRPRRTRRPGKTGVSGPQAAPPPIFCFGSGLGAESEAEGRGGPAG